MAVWLKVRISAEPCLLHSLHPAPNGIADTEPKILTLLIASRPLAFCPLVLPSEAGVRTWSLGSDPSTSAAVRAARTAQLARGQLEWVWFVDKNKQSQTKPNKAKTS